MTFLSYLLIGLIGFCMGFALAVAVTTKKKAGYLVVMQDQDDGLYYLRADLNLYPKEILAEKEVVFEIKQPTVGTSRIAKIK